MINNLGQFTKTDLAQIWNEDEYSLMRDELLQLMINFKLCYEIPTQPETYIAPQLLTENQPNFAWDNTSNLILRYTYAFMPKGIITQFIVAMHGYIASQQMVWRSGVVLEKDQTWAEVIEYYSRREIKIRISGQNRRALMIIVAFTLDEIHRSYKRLKVQRLIPCNCEHCLGSQTPHFYRFDVLQRFRADSQPNIQCAKSYEMVSVLALIDDVWEKHLVDVLAEKSAMQGTRNGLVFTGNIEKFMLQQTPSEIKNVMEEHVADKKVIKIGDKATVSGPIVIADSIENSFNTLQEAPVEDEIKQQLDALLKAIAQMTEAADLTQVEHTEAMARDAEALVKEVTSSKPRRRWYEVSLEGLKQAADNIGEVAEPVMAIVQRLYPLLLP